MRPEDLGLTADSARRGGHWTALLAPIVLALNIFNAGLSALLQAQARKRVKDVCFVSTFKTAAGMAAFPILWVLVAGTVAGLAPAAALGGGWTFAFLVAGQAIASRMGVWWWGHRWDARGRRAASKFWADGERARIWTEYVNTIENASA